MKFRPYGRPQPQIGHNLIIRSKVEVELEAAIYGVSDVGRFGINPADELEAWLRLRFDLRPKWGNGREPVYPCGHRGSANKWQNFKPTPSKFGSQISQYLATIFWPTSIFQLYMLNTWTPHAYLLFILEALRIAMFLTAQWRIQVKVLLSAAVF